MENSDDKKMTRRGFLKAGGSALIGIVVAGFAGRSVWKMLTDPDALFYGRGSDSKRRPSGTGETVSPYRLTGAFEVPDMISAMEVMPDGHIVIAMPGSVCVYSASGSLMENFAVRSDVRDVAAYRDRIYLLYADRIEIYGKHGEELGGWQACSDDADYCSFTVFSGGVFVTDASAKNICKYNLDGTLARFINSPKGFVVPSYSFGITNIGGKVFCSNPGRHVVEQYDADGSFIASFGESGAGAGQFCGCCNPVQLTGNNAGELLTSEKGIPRISCYSLNGSFRSILLDTAALGGGHEAYDMRVFSDRLIVAGRRRVSIFQYDDRRAAQTLCGSCTAPCPMKVTA